MLSRDKSGRNYRDVLEWGPGEAGALADSDLKKVFLGNWCSELATYSAI